MLHVNAPAQLKHVRAAALRSMLWLRWRLGFACCALLMGTACMDGYPTQDALILNPFNMTQTQRLVAMNTIGDGAHSQRSWSYAMLPGCVLRIDVDGELGPRPAFEVALLGSVIEIASDRADDTFSVAVAEPGDRSQAAAAVLQSEDWALASRTQLLLRVLQRGCSDAAGNTISDVAILPGQSAP
jgi:hypothetical protein